MTLQVKYGAESAQVGWWPEYWNLAGSEEQSSETNWRAKLVKSIREWTCFHGGKKTLYATKNEMPTRADPESVDSLMVRGRQGILIPTTDIEEASPSATYYLCVKDIKKVLNYAKTFQRESHRYHVLLNNCATVAAEALRAGGARVPKLPIISPRILSCFCKKNLVCSASSKT